VSKTEPTLTNTGAGGKLPKMVVTLIYAAASGGLAQFGNRRKPIWSRAFETMPAHQFPPKPFGRSFGRKFGVLYDDYAKDVSGSVCAINKIRIEIVLHTQEVRA